MNNKPPLLIDVLPVLAKDIKLYFLNKSLNHLSEQVDQLRIKELCDCDDPDCGSFYLTSFEDVENDVEGYNFENKGSIEVTKGKIGFIEIFPSSFGYEIRSKIYKFLSN
ncbi:hypothetical protein [Bacillus sp. EAC]|uniref:hypothetical protein n=1 Tax=Bacillus sp. EAC TaxID=1978338 RepID=UPI000B430399|nr:hypothetical protein [Bacillus sp. EAC]